MDSEKLIQSLHPLEVRILRALPEHGEAAEDSLCRLAELTEAQFRRGIEWLLSKSVVAVAREEVREGVCLTDLGKQYIAGGPPEVRLLEKLAARGPLPVPELLAGFDLPEAGGVAANPAADPAPYAALAALIKRVGDRQGTELGSLPPAEQETVRGLIHKRMRAKGVFYLERIANRAFAVTETGRAVRAEVVARGLTGEEVSRLTPQMLADGSWRGKSFRSYSFDFSPPRAMVARRHPYREFLDYLKYKLVSLGFQEMRGPLVECEFWNMDALYMPQFHAARDIHDAYYVKRPTHARGIDPEVLRRVAETHERGGEAGSRGWGYRFDPDKTRRLVLRTQGTALSARTCASRPNVPGKYFAFARCFRPDTVDATHACDFFQIEGIVLGEEINFRTLLGLLKLFAVEVAKAEEVKFVPGYFPFTEPSVEAHMRHPRLGWMELGGAGIFRPEVTTPLGVNVPVLAWGLGIDRMAMVALKIDDIRELFGTDLEAIRTRRLEMDFV
jgi:phenylalanyl-tRNA synthetase alpha chain